MDGGIYHEVCLTLVEVQLRSVKLGQSTGSVFMQGRNISCCSMWGRRICLSKCKSIGHALSQVDTVVISHGHNDHGGESGCLSGNQ